MATPDTLLLPTLRQIGLVHPKPSRREVAKVAAGMFALAEAGRGDTKQGLSSGVFIKWAQSHVIGSAILDSVERVSGPAVLCCAVLCCAVLCCAVLCCWSGWRHTPLTTHVPMPGARG